MPTGYTCDIEKGISFEKFALKCARNFGALISMRDEPMDAEIPNEFEPSSYYKDLHDEELGEINEIRNLTIDECEERATKEYKKRKKEIKNSIIKCNILRKKYESMLEQVEAWIPPTEDHIELKNFMKQQILSSIDFDCNTKFFEKELENLKPKRGRRWKKEELDYLYKSLHRHRQEFLEEVNRVNKRNAWIKALKKSLKVNRKKGIKKNA